MMKTYSKNMVNILCVVLLTFIAPAGVLALQITPQEMKVGTMFNGKDVVVSGEIGTNEDVVVQIVGSASEAEFKQTGKVGGLFWMTVGHLAISNAPSAYFVYLPKSVSDLRRNSKDRWLALQFDFNSLLPKINIEPEPADRENVFQDFLALKARDGLYQIIEDGVQYERTTDGKKKYTAQIHVPAKMPVSSYQIKVVKLTGDQAAGIETGEFSLKQTGFPLLISNLAFDHSLIYGTLAVIIAVFAGLFMGVLFQQKGGGAH